MQGKDICLALTAVQSMWLCARVHVLWRFFLTCSSLFPVVLPVSSCVKSHEKEEITPLQQAVVITDLMQSLENLDNRWICFPRNALPFPDESSSSTWVSYVRTEAMETEDSKYLEQHSHKSESTTIKNFWAFCLNVVYLYWTAIFG